jgi:hypothetical protein
VIIFWLLATIVLTYAAWKFTAALFRLGFAIVGGAVRIIFWW